ERLSTSPASSPTAAAPPPTTPAPMHAIRGLTSTAAQDYAAKGLRINELQPGVILTEMTQPNVESTRAVADRGILMRRIGTGREVATAIAFLLSDDASYITGQRLAETTRPRSPISFHK